MQKNNWIDKEFKKITNDKGVQRFIDKIKNMEVIVMNKDKNWLKNEVEKIWHSGHPRLGEVVEYEGLKNLIEQLEEPMKIPELPKFIDETIKDSSFTEISEIELVNKIKSRYSFFEWFEKKYPDASNREMERYLLIAILFDYTVEKEPEWIVKRKNNFYVDGFKKTIKGVEIDIAEPTSVTAPYKFSDKKLAESVAAVVNGETLDVTE